MASTTGFYQLSFSTYPVVNTNLFPFENGWSKLTDKYGATADIGLLHASLQGIVANDLSYITNLIVGQSSGPSLGFALFKLENLPSALTVLTTKIRVASTRTGGAPSGLEVAIYQGRPFFDSSLPTTYTQIAVWSPGSFVADVWQDIDLSVPIASITDRDDLWALISMQADNSGGRGVKISWLAFEVTSPMGRGETPTFKNYVNSLTKISNVSIRTIGTAGTSRYCYRIVPCDSAGVCGPASDEIVIEIGNATLNATNHICLSWLDVTGVTNYKVYRTCGPSNLGIGLLATVLPNLGDCGTGGGGGGDTGYKDDGSACVTDCAELFNLDDLEGCQGVTTVTFPSKETPT